MSRLERKGAKSKGRRAPWYRLSLDHFQKLEQMLVPDSLDPTDCPWVSEDDEEEDIKKELSRLLQDRIFPAGYPSSFLTPHDTA